VRTSEAINELAGALAKAQSEVQGAHRSSDNPFFKSKYADLASVWDACRKPLTDNGLAVIQCPSSAILDYDGIDDKGNPFKGTYAKVTVTTRLVHSSGQWIEEDFTAEAKDAGPQAIGSATTYLRRYSLQSVAGVAPEDDDGNAASKPGERPVQRTNVKANGKHEQSAEFSAFTIWMATQVPVPFKSKQDLWAEIYLNAGPEWGPTTLPSCTDKAVFNRIMTTISERKPVAAR